MCLAVEDGSRNLVGCFSVSLDGAEQSSPQALTQRIAAACAERAISFSETAVALDCGTFMQHDVHSEFSDVKKITQTVRFDTEEVLGADATDVAIAFKMDSADQSGSTLSVFTTQKQILAELISAFAAGNLDPVSVEPDVNCLARFIATNVTLPVDARPLFALLGRRNAYFLAPLAPAWQGVSPMVPMAMRTFLLGPQDRNEQLIKQVSMTVALLQTGAAVNCIEVFDTTNSINSTAVAKKLTVQTELIDILRSAQISPEQLADPATARSAVTSCPDPVEFAIAYGAATAFLDPPRKCKLAQRFYALPGQENAPAKDDKAFCRRRRRFDVCRRPLRPDVCPAVQ